MKRPKLKLKVSDIQDIENIEAVHQSSVVKVGNGAMVKSYKKYLNKDAVVIIMQDDPRHKEVSKEVIKQQEKEFKKEFEE